MGSHTDNERKICGGRVVIYQRTDVRNTTWHCRIGFPNQPYVRQSLKTTDEKEAEKVATKIYEDMKIRYERGLSLQKKKFEDVLASYLVFLAEDVESGLSKQKKLADQKAMSRYCLEYFKGRYIDAINTGHINEYQKWRRKYWTSGPGSKEETYTYQREGKEIISKKRPPKIPALSTQNSENVLLRAVFQHAARNDWLPQSQIPLIETRLPHDKKGKDAHRRPGLDRLELKRLIETSDKRLLEVYEDDRLYHQRAMLHTFIGIMAYSGMRPFEAMKLTWQDMEMFRNKSRVDHYWKIYAQGKSKQRWLVPLDGIDDFINAHISYTTQLLNERDPDREDGLLCDETPIFIDYDGTPLKSLARGFTALMKAASLHIDPETKKPRDAYCLRHYYATERLLAGVSVYTLAENMGTSVQMIERHYGHLKPEMAAAELTKTNEA